MENIEATNEIETSEPPSPPLSQNGAKKHRLELDWIFLFAVNENEALQFLKKGGQSSMYPFEYLYVP